MTPTVRPINTIAAAALAPTATSIALAIVALAHSAAALAPAAIAAAFAAAAPALAAATVGEDPNRYRPMGQTSHLALHYV